MQLHFQQIMVDLQTKKDPNMARKIDQKIWSQFWVKIKAKCLTGFQVRGNFTKQPWFYKKARPLLQMVKRSTLLKSSLQNWLVAGTKAASGNDCITPDGKAGKCAYVTDPICAPIYDVIQQRGNVKGEFLRYLQNAARFQFFSKYIWSMTVRKARLISN